MFRSFKTESDSESRQLSTSSRRLVVLTQLASLPAEHRPSTRPPVTHTESSLRGDSSLSNSADSTSGPSELLLSPVSPATSLSIFVLGLFGNRGDERRRSAEVPSALPSSHPCRPISVLGVRDGDFYDLTSSEEDNNCELLHPGSASRTSRSASVNSVGSGSSTQNELHPSTAHSNPSSSRNSPKKEAPFSMAMFDPTAKTDRDPPPLPDASGIEYVRAASWAAGSCANVLADDKGRQLFRCFLFQALAEENLSFMEALEKMKKMKSSEEKRAFTKEVIDTYSPYVNLSSGAMKKLKDAANSDTVDPEDFAPAIKEVKRLLENDQFPRFRRSEIYLEFLEQLLPKSYAEKWTTSFEALLGNHVGRHHFRLFLRGIHAEENLRFWEAVVEFRATKNKSQAMLNLAKVILVTYLAEGTSNEVFLPFGVRQMIERRVEEQEVDISLFDEAIKHVEQVLRNDPYVRFLQSPQYNGLLQKLRK